MALYKQAPAAPVTRLIGNERVGIIEVPVLGGLTLEEDETIDEIIATADEVVVLASQTAQRIALTEGQDAEGKPNVTEVEAYRIIEDAVFHRDMEDKAMGIAIRHAEAIAAVRNANKANETLRHRATVTAILRHRLGEQEIPADFPRVLFDGLAKLVQDEQASEKLPAQPMTAEALGKPPEATPAKRKRTGAQSSGS
jgi:predicted pyridoxine 5'-phosphate oxidase superfamily flavin-nucleotide-binding protein